MGCPGTLNEKMMLWQVNDTQTRTERGQMHWHVKHRLITSVELSESKADTIDERYSDFRKRIKNGQQSLNNAML
jgi:hypothetical protein